MCCTYLMFEDVDFLLAAHDVDRAGLPAPADCVHVEVA